jgi:hypothetical protein
MLWRFGVLCEHTRRLDERPGVGIAAINAFNRVSATTRQIAGDYVARIVEAAAGAAA